MLGIALGLGWVYKGSQQQKRIRLLAHYLSRHAIEKNIETVTQGYLRALGEAEPARREQVWAVLQGNEQALCQQVAQLAKEFAEVDPTLTRVSRLAIWLPVGPAFDRSFDMRQALQVHARGIARAVEVVAESDEARRDRAFAISAELLLLQHTCHWYCRSKLVATARLRALHQTDYPQVLAAVRPQTRADYLALVAPGT